MNIAYIWEDLRDLQQKFFSTTSVAANTTLIKELSFQALEYYCDMKKRDREKPENRTAICAIAIKLSGIVEKRLSGRAWRLLQQYEDKLPERVIQVLQANLQRMEGY